MKYKGIIPMDIFEGIELEPGEYFIHITENMVPGVYPYYMISNCGRVFHRYLRIIMKYGLETSGYLFITLSTINGPRIIQMNRLVLMAFSPILNSEMYQANHLDGNKLNNHLYNLEWATRSENILHAYRTGLAKPKTKISENVAIEIVEMLKNGKMCKDIASELGVAEYIVNSIKAKKSWNHLTTDCIFESRIGRMYSDNQVHILCNYFQEHPKQLSMPINDYIFIALSDCGFDNPKSKVDTARKIYGRKYYTNISKFYNF